MNNDFVKQTGFTLAEVLITLLIIGVVASLVIPSIIQDTQNAEYKTGYKKAFSLASQALLSCMYDNELVSRSNYDDGAANVSNFNCFKSKFSLQKNCNSSNNSQCWAQGEMFRGNSPGSNVPAFIDNSGMSWSMRTSDLLGCGGTSSIILVDINGFKSPNKYGRDRFAVIMANNNKGVSTDWWSINPYSNGMPVRIMPFYDAIDNTYEDCPSGNCFYTSWLKN
jgi:prepilin-type N-terminal cleavage/methylation domain-containing protein